jgi:deoxyribose-phosphate aldolase
MTERTNGSWDADQLEELVRAVTEEVLSCLDAPAGPAGATSPQEAACAECDGRCVEQCADRAHRVLDAGAERISSAPGLTEVEQRIAALIDHTLLKPEASRAEIKALCGEAVRFGFASVCVNPWYVPLAAELVRGSAVKVCTVVGFPLGATLTRVKMFEAEEAITLGAQELDMVLNIGALKSGQTGEVEADIRAVVQTAHRGGAICKVILEAGLLGTEEKVWASLAAARCRADFVKTSTGFGPRGATAEDVALIRATVGQRMGIKAAGGIRSLEDFEKMVSAGATRIGASASVRILRQARPFVSRDV